MTTTTGPLSAFSNDDQATIRRLLRLAATGSDGERKAAERLLRAMAKRGATTAFYLAVAVLAEYPADDDDEALTPTSP